MSSLHPSQRPPPTSAAAPAHIYQAESSVDEATTWMQPMQRSWEEITEDEAGDLKSTQLQREKERKKQLQSATASAGGSGTAVIEKGVIRYLYIILDFSWCMNQTDMKPSRKALTLDYLEQFIHEFFDQNPISQLGFIVSANKLSYHITELSGNPLSQIQALREVSESGGDFSLQNSLEMARQKLAQIPPYGSREILILMSALCTVDPGDIHETITACQQSHITCSVISLAAEMYVCTLLATTTGGSCNVVLNRDHYKTLLFSHIPPLPAHKASSKQKQARKWIHMGFPEQKYEPYPSLCACHEELRYGGYNCPKCLSKFCELPTECKVCSLTLVSSPHLARSYHHLFPVPNFIEIEGATNTAVQCRSCCRTLIPQEALQLQCPLCEWIVCMDCDEYIHTILHNCPGCTSRPQSSINSTKQETTTTMTTARSAAPSPVPPSATNTTPMQLG